MAQDDPPQFVPDELLVKFKPGKAPQKLAQLNGRIGATVIGTFFGDSDLYHIKIPQGFGVGSAMTFYNNDLDIEYAEPNYVYTLEATPDDPRFGSLWGLQKIQAEAAWDLFTGSPDIVIADTDTGIDYNHPDLLDNIWVNTGEIPDNGIDDDGNGFIDDVIGWDFAADNNDPIDRNNHGSHTAGTIGAVGNNGIGVVGVNWQVKIMPLKICPTFSCSLPAAVRAIDYAIMMGARAINASWGGTGVNQALRDAIGRAEAAGVLFIAAAGNSRADIDTRPFYPVGYGNNNIIGVSATTNNDGLAGFSNFGAKGVHLGAPGSGILSTTRNGNYGSMSGTSMAAPHVTGAAALVWGYNPDLTAGEVKTILLKSVDPIPALDGKTITGGRLNIFKALQMAQ
jgi:subtilisin family serine protease